MCPQYEFRSAQRKIVIVSEAETPYPESDDQYALCICIYTHMLFVRKEGIVLGPIVPQATKSYLCHPLAGSRRKGSIRQFQEYEQNCNTCKYLLRLPFGWKEKNAGLHPGECLNEKRKPLYPCGSNKIMFAPDDCMLQSCYESR